MVKFLQNSRLVRFGLNVVTILFLLSSSDVVAQKQSKVILSTPVETVGGYLEHVPDEYAANPGKSYPLLLFIHGLGEVGSGSDADMNKLYRNGPPNLLYNGKFPTSFTVGGKTHKFIVISPQFNRTWPNQAVIMNFIKYLKTRYRIDDTRIYLTGLSMGGGVVWNTAGASTTNAHSFAAIAPVCGASGANRSVANIMASQNLPIWAFHNDGDPSVDVRNTIGYTDYFNQYVPKANPQARRTIWKSTSHNAWGTAYDPNYKENNQNLYEWMLSYTTSGSVQPTPPNQLPTANAGVDQSITLPTSTVNIDGGGSRDPDGTLTSHAWTQVSGPVTAKFGNAWISKTNITGMTQAGTYVFRLTVTDNMGAKATDDLVVTVKGGTSPLPPVANAGTAQTIQLPASSATLTSQSKDPDGSITTNYWTQTAGPVNVSFSNQWGASTQVNNMTTAGTYTFQLRVTDNGGNTANAWVNVVVQPAAQASAPPTVNAGSAQTLTLPTNSTTLSGSSSTLLGSILSNVWTQVSGPTNASFLTTQWLPSTRVGNLTKPGTYVFELKATNSSNQSATSTVTIVVKEAAVTTPKQAPVASTVANFGITLPLSVAVLTGSATDADGTIAHYYWSQIDGPTTASFLTSQWLPVASVGNLSKAGTYRFQLRVMDNDNQYAYDTLAVTVSGGILNPAPVTGPVANAGADFEVVVESAGTANKSTAPDIFTYLDGSASYAPGGSIDQYYWRQISGPNTVTWGNAWYHKPKVLDMAFGEYEFALRVMDNKKEYAYDTVKVTVKPAGLSIPPVNTSGVVADAGADIAIPSSQGSVTLDGSKSYSTGGTITNYFWRYVSGPSVFLKDTWRATPTLTNFGGPGEYFIELMVTDNSGKTAFDTIKINVWNAGTNLAAAAKVPTGIEVTEAKNALSIYPNPIQSQATIKITAPESGKGVLIIYNATGAPVYQESFEKSGTEWMKSLNLSNLGKGTYFMKVQIGKTSLQQKLMKL